MFVCLVNRRGREDWDRDSVKTVTAVAAAPMGDAQREGELRQRGAAAAVQSSADPKAESGGDFSTSEIRALLQAFYSHVNPGTLSVCEWGPYV